MKKMSVILGLALALGVSTSARALEFTPRTETQMIDGYAIHYLSYPDGDQRVGYGPPTGWKCSGGGNKLIIQDPTDTSAEANLTVLPNDKPGPLTPEIVQTFKTAALALLPKDCQDPSFAESTGRHPMGNLECYTASLTYGYYGKKYATRITFVNLGPSYLQILCTAPSASFDPFIKTLDSSFFNWHWYKP